MNEVKLDFNSRKNVIKMVLSQKRYFFLFLLILSVYVAVNIWINQFSETIPVLLSFRLSFVIPYLVLSIIIGILVALNLTVLIYKIREVRAINKEQTSATAVGMLGGLLGGACPGCFVGLLPTLAGVFGITISLSSLPFLGFEIQIPTLLILLVTLYIAAQPLTCKIEIKGD